MQRIPYARVSNGTLQTCFMWYSRNLNSCVTVPKGTVATTVVIIKLLLWFKIICIFSTVLHINTTRIMNMFITLMIIPEAIQNYPKIANEIIRSPQTLTIQEHPTKKNSLRLKQNYVFWGMGKPKLPKKTTNSLDFPTPSETKAGNPKGNNKFTQTNQRKNPTTFLNDRKNKQTVGQIKQKTKNTL